jgi:hypothetical protein
MLLAIVVSALLWATAARPGSALPDDIITMSGAESCLLAGDSHEPGDSGREWRARHHTTTTATESVWKSAPVHAALAATRLAPAFDTVLATSSPAPAIRSAAPYLRHTPLLI